MITLKQVALAVLLLSFVVFCALFGSLPRLRKTPIGMINRLLWIKLPRLLLGVDRLVTGGRCIRILKRTGRYLMKENHPLILIMYLTLLIACQVAFIPPVHAVLPWSYRLPMYPLTILPYWFTYRSATSTASFVSAAKLPTQLREYPYDRVLFRAGQFCTTCQLVKPARSKHCRICRRCVHRMDHHCIWVRNCLGRENYVHFLAMLLSLATMLAYGAWLGYMILDATIQDATDDFTSSSASRATASSSSSSTSSSLAAGARWTKGLTWTTWFDRWTWAFAMHVRVGAIAMLASMTAPLAGGLFAYHVYLIYRGTTTNESFKWDEWAEDVQDGYVYACADVRGPRPELGSLQFGEGDEDDDDDNPKEKVDEERRETSGVGASNGASGTVTLPIPTDQRTRAQLRTQLLAQYLPADLEPRTRWPAQPRQVLVSRANRLSLQTELFPETVLGAEPWRLVNDMSEIDNVYDLGFWKNVRDALGWSVL